MANPFLSDRVAIIGGGPIGLMAAKLSLASGVKNTFLFEPNEFRRKLAKKIGINNCIDPLKETELNSVEKNFNIALEISGTPKGLQTAMEYCVKNGKVIVVGIYPDKVLIDVKNQIMSKELILMGTFGRHIWNTWFQMIEILSNKQIDLKEIITHRYSFDQYKEAFEVALSGKCGKIILKP